MKRVLILPLITLLCTLGGVASAGIVDPCLSTWTLNGTPPYSYIACPLGDTDSFQDQGWSITMTIRDQNGLPIPMIPRTDFWLIDCDPLGNVILCGGAGSSNADAPTDASGTTTMSSGTLVAGGCADGVAVVCQGVVLEDPSVNCVVIKCEDVAVRSPDQDGDLVVTLVDFTIFGASYPPNPYDPCADLNADGAIDLSDFAQFVKHWAHQCGGPTLLTNEFAGEGGAR